jgi:hypothetical protein
LTMIDNNRMAFNVDLVILQIVNTQPRIVIIMIVMCQVILMSVIINFMFIFKIKVI